MNQIKEWVDIEKRMQRGETSKVNWARLTSKKKFRKTKDTGSFDVKIVALVTVFASNKNKQQQSVNAVDCP
jgi:hypothetical protein